MLLKLIFTKHRKTPLQGIMQVCEEVTISRAEKNVFGGERGQQKAFGSV